jgi:hypothetical protein
MGQFDKFLPGPGLPTSGNRAVGKNIVVKPKPKAAGAPPGNPPKPPKNKPGIPTVDGGAHTDNWYLKKGKK